MTCTHKAPISVGTVSIDVTVVPWIGLTAFIDIYTIESISQVSSVTATVIASNVVCADTVHVTLMCSLFTLVNICM